MTEHCPLLQLLAPPITSGHTLAQPPQFLESVLGSTQTSPHFARPPLQLTLH